MISSPSIDQLCSLLSLQYPDWENIRSRFEKTPLFKQKTPLLIHQYAQYFSELSLDFYLEQISKENHSLPMKIFPYYSLKKPLRNESCKLYHNYLNRIHIDSGIHKSWEYDQLVFINNNPVVLEIKIRKWNTGKKRKRKQQNGTYTIEKDNCVKNNLRPEIYDQKLEPVRQIFNQDVGYIMIISSDQYQKVCNSPPDSTVGRFLQNNGKIVPFYTDRLTFREHVREKVKEYGYPLKEEPSPPSSSSSQPRIHFP